MNVEQAGEQPTAAYQAAIDFLYSRINYEKVGHAIYSAANYRLDRMRRLLELIGNPQTRYRIIHVAGTKGKGTTCMVISHLLCSCGFRVGLFTSPHLLRLEERIQCNGIPCSAEALVGLVNRIRDAAELLESEGGGRPTFFEMTTAMGMMHFADAGCDIAVLEVGLGGRLDSTNVCQPDVAVITSISFDHQAQLGNTIASIAREKAGIIKPRVPVVCSARDPEARLVIEQQAQICDAPIYLIDREFTVQWRPLRSLSPGISGGEGADLPPVAQIHYETTNPQSTIGNSTWQLPILGRHQADNVAAALTAVDLLLHSQPTQQLSEKTPLSEPTALAASVLSCLAQHLSEESLFSEAKLQRAFSSLALPARLQLVATSPVQIIDTAHNPASLAATLSALEEHFPNQSRTIVFASSRDKEYAEMLRILIPRCQRLVLTAYQNNPRALTLPELQVAAKQIEAECLASKLPEILSADRPAAAWTLALRHSDLNSIICGTGSFFLAAELLPLF